MLYDAVYLYALGLNAVFWQGLDERNGTQIISELVNHTFHGMLPTNLPTYLPTYLHIFILSISNIIKVFNLSLRNLYAVSHLPKQCYMNKKEKVSMIRKYHHYTLQTNTRHSVEEPHNTNSHKTSG